MSSSLVKHVGSSEEFKSLISSTTQPIVVDFQAEWCGPCRMMAPILDTLSVEYANRVLFLSVDVDALQEVAQAFQVQAMPTFVLVQGGQEVGRLQGAQPDALKAKIKAVLEGGGVGGASGSDNADPTIPTGFVDLREFTVKNKISCLNEKVANSVHVLLGAGTKTAATIVESDCDEQLLISIGFSQPVKIHSLRFTVPTAKLNNAPQNVKLYINRVALGFDETGTVPFTQEAVFRNSDYVAANEAAGKKKPEGLSVATLSTRFVKFQKVTELFIFVESNLEEGELTILNNIQIIGVPLQAANMDNLKKMDDH